MFMCSMLNSAALYHKLVSVQQIHTMGLPVNTRIALQRCRLRSGVVGLA